MVNVYDNVLNFELVNEFYKYAIDTNYKLGFQDSNAIEKRNFFNIHSLLSMDQIRDSNILESLDKINEYKTNKNNLIFSKSVINLIMFTDSNYIHVHPNQHVILIYLNPEWVPDWAGETVFFDDNCQEVVKSITPKPGRAVYFDGSTPHSIRCQNQIAPQFRFTLSIFFNLWKN